MATTIKVWEIAGGVLKPAVSDDLAMAHVEAELESWITQNPEVLGAKILLIDRQREIAGVGRLDLLGIDESGSLVIIELKRDLTSREAVAQALDYAAWLDSESAETIAEFAQQFLKRPLADAFLETFQTELPDLICQNHRVLLVAARLDASAERIINYLAERYGVEINAVFFKYSKLSDGKEILARSILVEDTIRTTSKPTRKHPSLDQLLSMADERMTRHVVEVCREMRHAWRETCRWTYGGSFRYWADTPSGAERMVFGVNVAGNAAPPRGELGVWIPAKSLSESSGVPEAEIRSVLTNTQLVRSMAYDCWLRLKSPEDAEKLIAQLQHWASQAAKTVHA